MVLPKVSIITVCYNSIDTIDKTIQNTLKQTYKNFEYILVDGASTDGTLEVIKKYNDSIHWISEPDNGIYDAMNKGLKIATGEWVLFRNSGDFFNSPTVLEKIFSEYDDNGEDLIIGNLRSFGKKSYYDLKPSILSKHYFEEMPVHHPSTLIRRSTHLKYLFPQYLKLSADYWSMISILRNNGKYRYIDIIISLYDNSCGASKENWEKGLDENIDILKNFGADDKYIQNIRHFIQNLKHYNKRHSLIFYKIWRCLTEIDRVKLDNILSEI